MWYRNTGGPIPRADGTMVPKGALFEPNEREKRQFSYKIEPVETPAPKDVLVQPAPPPPPPPPPEWPMNMRPELYLQLHPEGKHAPMARRILGLPEPEKAPAPKAEKPKTRPTLFGRPVKDEDDEHPHD